LKKPIEDANDYDRVRIYEVGYILKGEDGQVDWRDELYNARKA